MERQAKQRAIVAGVDGSESSKRALAWAAAQAELTGSPLSVVAAWEVPTTYGWEAPLLPEGVDLEASARQMLERTIKEVLGSDPGIELHTEVIEGHPAPELTEKSKNASLVVVGSRGHGEFTGMQLGSVSEFLVANAHCPVVVVRGDAAPESPRKPSPSGSSR